MSQLLPKLWLLTSGCLIATLSLAQQRSEPADLPFRSPWFVQAQLAAQRYRVAYPATGNNEQSILPAQLSVGYQLADRLGVQVGAAYRREKQNRLISTPTGAEPTDERWRLLTVPVWARFTLTRKPEHRAQFDLIGGVTVLSGRHEYSTLVAAGPSAPAYVQRRQEHLREVHLNYGLSARYRLGRRLEAVVDGAFNQGLGKARKPFNLSFYTANAGLRYSFK